VRVLFCGTPDFAAAVLGALLESAHPVVGVVSQPGRPQGRGLQMEDPPAARLARAAGLPLFQPERLHSSETLGAFRGLEPDVLVTAAFGRILRPALLDLPPRGCWNVHASLLPRHRGASPVTAALLAGDAWTGVTLFRMDPGLDTGPMLLQEMTPIGPAEDSGELTDRLARVGGRLVVEALDREERGLLPAQPQPAWGSSYAPILRKEDGRIIWDRPVEQVDRLVRAVTPWPGAFTFLDNRRLRVHRVTPVHRLELRDGEGRAVTPGTIVPLPSGWTGIGVACRPGLIALREVQSEGRKRQEAREWMRGNQAPPGLRLDPPR
jgi:methionyl-tRNA formyltransferase